MNRIPQKIRKHIESDPYYKVCALEGIHGHICEGRITMEHALYHAGKQIQAIYAILPVCAGGHGVDAFQNNASTSKELREWVCLNRATEIELRGISKAVDYIRRRNYLNSKYGMYEPKALKDLNTINY